MSDNHYKIEGQYPFIKELFNKGFTKDQILSILSVIKADYNGVRGYLRYGVRLYSDKDLVNSI